MQECHGKSARCKNDCLFLLSIYILCSKMPKAKTNKLLTARIGKQLVFPPNCYTRTWQLAQWCHGMVVMITVK